MLALAGCGVGSGAGPSDLRIVDDAGTAGPYDLIECGSRTLHAISRWSGDADYDVNVTGTAHWESSNPSAVAVTGGVIVARAPGTARIKATYVDFTASVVVRVAAIVEQRINPDVTHLAPGSSAKFRLQVRGDVDDPWLDADAAWALPQVDAPATVEAATGVVRAGPEATNLPFTLEARLAGCAVSASRELVIGAVDRIELEYEQPPDLTLPLALSTLIRVWVHFADAGAAPQNISDQVEIDLERTDDDVVRVSAQAEGIRLQGLVDGARAQLAVRYPPLDVERLTTPYVFGDLEPLDLHVTPAHMTLHYPEEGQFDAWSTFTDGRERRVTREATWSLGETPAAFITTNAFDAGRLVVRGDVDQDLRVEAFLTIDGAPVSAEAEAHLRHAP